MESHASESDSEQRRRVWIQQGIDETRRLPERFRGACKAYSLVSVDVQQPKQQLPSQDAMTIG
jgi:hypothetical protein